MDTGLAFLLFGAALSACQSNGAGPTDPIDDMTPNDDVAGQSGTDAQGHDGPGKGAPPVPTCSCMDANAQHPLATAIRGRLVHSAGGCAELEITDVGEQSYDLAVGDVVGGEYRPLCKGDPTPEVGSEVLAFYSRGGQDSLTCVEYIQCSEERCGSLEQAEADTDANDDQAANWDRCDTECLEETRELCAEHAEEAALGGTLTVVNIEDDTVTYFWAGEERRATLAELGSDTCQHKHQQLFSAYQHARSFESDAASSGGQTAPTSGEAVGSPPEVSNAPQCPSPGRLTAVHADAGAANVDAGTR